MRRYLTGIDWVIHSIDYAGKAQSGIGNVSEVIVELRGRPDSGILRESLRSFLQEFPLLNGLPSRGLNLCPYWKVYPQKSAPALRVHVAHLEDDADPFMPLAAQVNAPFADKREHLVFNLVRAGTHTLLGMTFDHRILDARGAEAFLDMFQHYYKKEPLPEIALDEPPRLDHWREKFIAGRQVNRFFLDLTKNTPRTLPAPLRSRVCRFKVIRFDPSQTGRFTDAAHRQAGYLMLMPYALAGSVQIMHRIFESRNIPGATYLIPVSIDTRPQEAARKEPFFSHVSFFIFKIEARIVTDPALLLARIKEQMYEQVKAGLPEALKNASFLLRIAPLPLTNFFLRCMSKKQFASFSFSFVGSAYHEQKFMEEDVDNIVHVPRVPNPPGLGIFFNQFNGRMNATLSYFDGLLSDKEAGQIAAGLNALDADG